MAPSDSLLNIAIIGSGVIAPNHIAAYQCLPHVKVKTLCDLVPSKADALAKQYGIEQVASDAAQVFQDPEIQAVSICTDHVSHSDLSLMALRAGKHVICEKPLASDCARLDAMIHEGDEHPDLVFTGIFQHRFEKINRYSFDLLRDPRFGKILNAALVMQCLRTPEYYATDAWRGKWASEGGSLLMNQAIHFVDLLQWMMGGVETLHGFWSNQTHQGIIETEDSAVAALRFQNGVLGTLTSSSSSHLSWEYTLSFFGEDSTLELRDSNLFRFKSKDQEFEQEVIAAFHSMNEERALNQDKYYYGNGHFAQIADFVEAIRAGRPPFVSVRDAAHAVRIAQQIYAR